jgi:hypothetical protein
MRYIDLEEREAVPPELAFEGIELASGLIGQIHSGVPEAQNCPLGPHA